MLLALDELCWLGSDEVKVERSRLKGLTLLQLGFDTPHHDLDDVLEKLGIKLFSRERTLAQYVSWSARTGLISFLDKNGPSSIDSIVNGTDLTEAGADSLLGILCALGFAMRSELEQYDLSNLSRDFLLKQSPYYIADQIEATGFPIPRPYLKHQSQIVTAFKLWLLGRSSDISYGSVNRLLNQHARNLAACAAVVRNVDFDGMSSIIDLAGGSGSFSIPLALDFPDLRIVLVDLPEAIIGSRKVIAAHGLEGRIALRGVDLLKRPWDIGICDGLFVGNFLHGFADDVCVDVLKESYRHLSRSGRIWIHERLWNANRDGPLITALWHAAMRSAGPGRQRTEREFTKLLEIAGYRDISVSQTCGAYSIMAGRKD